MPRRSTILALIGALLVAVTAAGWMWSAAHLLSDGVRTGILACCAATVAWTSGAPTPARVGLRLLHSILAAAVVAAAVLAVLGSRGPGGAGYMVSYEAGLELVAFAATLLAIGLGWTARRTASAARRRLSIAGITVPVLAVGTIDVAGGAELRGALAISAALWLAAVLGTPPSGIRPTRRWIAGFAAATAVLGAGALTGALYWPDDGPRRIYEYGDVDAEAETVQDVIDQYDAQQDTARVPLTP